MSNPRTLFEDEHHLARALSRLEVAPAKIKQWKEQVGVVRPWTRPPIHTYPAPKYEQEALEQIHKKSFAANVLLEIRDVRLPASTHHPSFTRLARHRLHLICYTHADMIDAPTRDRVEEWTLASWPNSRSIFVDTREHLGGKNFDLVYDSLLHHIEERGGINTALTVGVPNTGKSSLLLHLLKHARASSQAPKVVKITEGKKRKVRTGKRAEVQDVPGKTRVITEYLVREKPRAFFLDVPGITPHYIFFEERPEAWYGYGAANLLTTGKVADLEWKIAFCEYILHCLNRDGNFQYVIKLGLDGPETDFAELMPALKRDKYNDPENEKLQHKQCDLFLKFFNTGNLGSVVLDDLSRPYEPFQFTDEMFKKKNRQHDEDVKENYNAEDAALASVFDDPAWKSKQ
jgi:ribosome biogenesis GTPase A